MRHSLAMGLSAHTNLRMRACDSLAGLSRRCTDWAVGQPSTLCKLVCSFCLVKHDRHKPRYGPSRDALTILTQSDA